MNVCSPSNSGSKFDEKGFKGTFGSVFPIQGLWDPFLVLAVSVVDDDSWCNQHLSTPLEYSRAGFSMSKLNNTGVHAKSNATSEIFME